MKIETRIEHLPEDLEVNRLDQALAQLFSEYSRSRIQGWIKDGKVLVDGKVLRPRDSVRGGERIEMRIETETEVAPSAENIPLDIVYQDDCILVINKPAGLVVHPAVGNRAGTLMNALLHYAPELASVPRAGIVHRLDKLTTGLLVVARTLQAHKSLVDQLQERTVGREYRALVHGVITAGATLEAPIGRHKVHRKRMAVVERGRDAITHYRVVERFRLHTYLKVNLETGRTHQIRVHMAHLKHPVVGDPEYSGRLRMPPAADEALRDYLHGFRRQALHARRLELIHPDSGETVAWECEPPEDMQALLQLLRKDVKQHA